jgi:hypothetical protein
VSGIETEDDALRALEAGAFDDGLTAEPYLDVVPTIDQEEPVVGEYPDWDEANTEIVTCRIANDDYKGRRFETVAQARTTITAERGRIREENFVPGRAFFRVDKVKA